MMIVNCSRAYSAVIHTLAFRISLFEAVANATSFESRSKIFGLGALLRAN
jgi:hypothetical protein